MKNPFAPTGTWTIRARPRDYIWDPDEIHFDLWHEIIDAYGLPAWIREYTDLLQPVRPRENRDEIYVENALHQRVTTEHICERTHALWVPVAYTTRMVSTSRYRWGNAGTSVCHSFFGYYAVDFYEHDLLTKPEEHFTTATHHGTVRIMDLPDHLLL